MLSFKQHKLCFWRFCTGSVVKNFFNIKYSHTGGAGDLKFREILILAEGFRKNSDQKYTLLSANAFV